MYLMSLEDHSFLEQKKLAPSLFCLPHSSDIVAATVLFPAPAKPFSQK